MKMPDPISLHNLLVPGLSVGSTIALIAFMINLTSKLRTDVDKKIKEHSESKDEARHEWEVGNERRMTRQWERIEAMSKEKLDIEKHVLVCRSSQLETEKFIREALEPIYDMMRKNTVCISNIDGSLKAIQKKQHEITSKWVKTVIPADG